MVSVTSSERSSESTVPGSEYVVSYCRGVKMSGSSRKRCCFMVEGRGGKERGVLFILELARRGEAREVMAFNSASTSVKPQNPFWLLTSGVEQAVKTQEGL